MTAAPEPTWGDPETLTIGDLRPMDFVERVPPQANYRGTSVQSLITEVRDDWTWTCSPGYRRRRVSVPARIITFHHGGPISYPSSFTVIARRRTS